MSWLNIAQSNDNRFQFGNWFGALDKALAARPHPVVGSFFSINNGTRLFGSEYYQNDARTILAHINIRFTAYGGEFVIEISISSRDNNYKEHLREQIRKVDYGVEYSKDPKQFGNDVMHALYELIDKEIEFSKGFNIPPVWESK